MEEHKKEKTVFLAKLSEFANRLGDYTSLNDEWVIKGFIDVFQNIYPLSTDTKIVSKVLEIHLFPYLLAFAKENGYDLELASHQNRYPDLTFILQKNPDIRFAVDIKTTYRDEGYNDFCNGFTLGSHGEYFINRESTKNVQYAYNEYSGHFCLGIIYSRNEIIKFEEMKTYSVEQLQAIPSVIKSFTFFAQEKWKIASDKSGSGNTANIGSIKCISDILCGNGVFAKAGEEYFDDYWSNYGKMEVRDANGKRKKLSSFSEYLSYRRLPASLNNPRSFKRKEKQ